MSEAEVAAQRVATLLDELAGVDERVGATAEELVRALTGMYGAALATVTAALDESTLRALAADDLVGALLVLHDLHPDGLETRVARALDSVRPALGSHAGGVELVGISEEPTGAVVSLRLQGSCHGCPSSTVTVTEAIERAIVAAAPEVARVDVTGVVADEPAPALLQIRPYQPYAVDGSDCPAVVGAGS